MNLRTAVNNTLLLVLTGITIFTIGYSVYNGYQLNIKNWTSLTCLCFVIIVFFALKKHFPKALGILLLLGLFDIVSFTYYSSSFEFSFNFWGIELKSLKVQLVSFCGLVFFCVANKNSIKQFINSTDPVVHNSNNENEDDDVSYYEKKYAQLTNQELSEVIKNSDSYQEAAIIAVKKILKQREDPVDPF